MRINGLALARRGVLCLVIIAAGMLSALAADTWPNCNFKCTAGDVTLVSVYAVVSGGACEPSSASTARIYGRFTASAKRYAVILMGDLQVEGDATRHLEECAGDLSAGTTDVLLATVTWSCGSAITLGNMMVSWSASPETCAGATCSSRAAKCSTGQDLVVATPLVVDFTSNSPQCPGTPVAFSNASTGGAAPFSYSWTFGDGGTSSQANPSHAYAAPGTYTVRLTVRDRTGASDSHSHTVAVPALPTASASNGGPYCPGNTVSLFANGGASYAWTGPGGFTSSAQNPSLSSASTARAGTYTVTVTGSVGCTAQASTIVVVDSTPPILTAPASTTVECHHPTSPMATGQATATDDSGAVSTVSYSDAAQLSGCGGTGTIARTWTAVDACGNSTSAFQTITVADATPPLLLVPADIALECGHSTLPDATGQATATDSCTTPTITYTDRTLVSGCSGTGVIERTWIAADACGNETTGIQRITIADRGAPTLSLPADVTVDCGHATEPAATGQATATDGCSPPTVTHEDATSTTGCSGSGAIMRTWRATDACGHAATGTQTITIADTAPPQLTAPADVTVECGHSTAPAATGQAAASDNCSTPFVTYEDDPDLSGCGGTGAIYRTWTAADACGHTATVMQTILVVDLQAPLLTVPTDVMVEAGQSTLPSATGQAVATDTCSATIVTYNDQTALTSDGTGTITRSWTAVDACGNTTSGIQSIELVSAPPPVTLTLTIPGDVAVATGDPTDPSATGEAVAVSTCATPPTLTYSDAESLTGCDGTGRILRTWAATDGCGNATSAVQTITVIDEGRVLLTVPADTTVEAGEPTDPSATGWASASDPDAVDEPPIVTYSDAAELTGCDGTGTILRTWTATDDCGNATSAVQMIAVVDSGHIELTVPADVTLELGSATDPAAAGWASASDPDAVDEPPMLTYADIAELTGCGGTGRILRTWTATDECGNSTSAVQTLLVVDTLAPALTVPPDMEIETIESADPAATGWATASHHDAHVPVAVSYSDLADLTGCDGTGTILRTWTAADECGNAVSEVQTIRVVDTGHISLLLPPDTTVACGHSYHPSVTGEATASDPDAVDEAPEVMYEDAADLAGCGGTGVVLRTWTAADECGNTVSAVQTITLADVTPPALSIPAGALVEFGESTEPAATGRAEALDLCSTTTLAHSDVALPGACAGRITLLRTWTAADECGNSASAVQTILVDDTTAPALALPADAVVECGHSTSPAATGQAAASDRGSTPTITHSDRTSPATCGGTRIIERVWTAVDACGNAATGVQTIANVDSMAPELTVPADDLVQVGDSVLPTSTGLAEATDACSTFAVTYTDESHLTLDGTGTITRTWTAVDTCGNAAAGVQTITVSVAPPPPHLSLVVPGDRTVDAGQPTDPSVTGMAVASGSCPTPATVGYTDLASLTGCDGTGVILRTWTAYDACGNTAVGAQTITVVDVGHVALLLPADLTVPCGDPTSPEATGWASASDPDATDEPPSVTYDDVAILDPCTGAGTILRTWAATDACGNAVSAVQSITVGGSCVARVIISEIAWAGTTANSPDEWIELRNMSDESVDLEGWTLRWRLAKPATREDEAWKTLRLHGVLAPAQRHQGLLLHTSASRPATWWLDLADLRPAPDYLLAERISDATVSNVLAGVVYDDRLEEERALELSDEGEIVELIAPGGCVVDSANAERMGVGGWAAGSAATHGTMERTDALRGDVEANWHTNLGLITHGIDADGLSLVATAGTDNQPLIERLPTMEFLDLISVRRGNSIELRLPARAFLGDPRVPRVLAFESGDADPIPPPVDVSMADTSLVVVASESARTGDYDVWVRAGEVVVPVPLRVDP